VIEKESFRKDTAALTGARLCSSSPCVQMATILCGHIVTIAEVGAEAQRKMTKDYPKTEFLYEYANPNASEGGIGFGSALMLALSGFAHRASFGITVDRPGQKAGVRIDGKFFRKGDPKGDPFRRITVWVERDGSKVLLRLNGQEVACWGGSGGAACDGVLLSGGNGGGGGAGIPSGIRAFAVPMRRPDQEPKK
jgi:hypothetical protein